ncbi:MAG: hypothetical protein AAGD23_11330, partial [Pseudomonadota bacterium]
DQQTAFGQPGVHFERFTQHGLSSLEPAHVQKRKGQTSSRRDMFGVALEMNPWLPERGLLVEGSVGPDETPANTGD